MLSRLMPLMISPYDGQDVKMKTPFYIIGVTKAIRKKINKTFDDEIEVTLCERKV